MRRFEQKGEILRALLISGTVISMLMIVGTHPVTGTPSPDKNNPGYEKGEADCREGKSYNPYQNTNEQWIDDYISGWIAAQCKIPDNK
jgi:hypothetical protein